jgi:hypothetical protein
MKIIAFTCCVNYSDMLKITYPHNKNIFDDIIVVTSPHDLKTIAYCEHNQIAHIESTAYLQDGSAFNRAAMLNKAIDYCHKAYPNEWYASIDVDVIFDIVDNRKINNWWLADWCSMDTRQPILFGDPNIDKSKIYGCPRKMITEPCDTILENLRKVQAPWFHYPYNLCAYLGYFQMFYKKTAHNDESYKTVNDSDTAFLNNNFSINDARTFSNLIAYHLGENGINWEGRKSKEWK